MKIKNKSTILFVSAIFIAFAGFGQSGTKNSEKEYKDRLINFGVKVGLNLNHLSTKTKDFNSSVTAGFKGGLFGRFNIRQFHIQPEINFAMFGGSGTFQNGGEYTVRINAIEMPLLFGYKIINSNFLNLRAQAGVYGAYHLERSISVNDPNYPENNSFTREKMSEWNAGLVIGAGVDVWRFTFDLRYQWGLINLMGRNSFQHDPSAGFKQGTFEISVGFKIF
jgi:hypothetical protein